MLKLNAKNETMKRLIFIISVIFISFQFTAQTNKSDQPNTKNSSRTFIASELKKKNFNQFQVLTKKKIMTRKRSVIIIDPKVEPKNEILLEPKQ